MERAMEEERTLILLNNTWSALNSQEAWQLQVKPIGSNWVYKTKHNPDRSTWYNARLVIKGYEQTDFGQTCATVGKSSTFRYLISLIRRYGWNMSHLDVVTTFLNPDIGNDNIHITLPNDGQKFSMPQKLSSDPENLSMVLNKLRGYGMTISTLFYSLLGSLNPLQILTSKFAVTAFWYGCMLTVSPCHVWRPQPKVQLNSKWKFQRSAR